MMVGADIACEMVAVQHELINWCGSREVFTRLGQQDESDSEAKIGIPMHS
jgi:hypothetical protein